ncbi:MAG: hypothetical protein KDD06_22165, partial [Phaeodactylibacter sp.]|nr:hypothetical protein [Phaeodactylibacter sp.]
MKVPSSFLRPVAWFGRLSGCILPLVFFFCSTSTATGQTLLSEPGPFTYNNTDSRTTDIFGPVDISNCTSVSFSLDYSFSLPWEGPGNMESCDDECISPFPCGCDPNIPAVVGDPCYNCWDFLWVRFMVGGVEVGGDLIGDSGTTDAEQSGTISGTFCTDGLAGSASIEVYTQTWASNESVTFSNVTITCIDDSPTLAPIGPFCETDGTVVLGSNQGGIDGSWSGPGVSGSTFTPSVAGAGTWTLTFTANPGECAGSATTDVTVNPAITPALTPIGPFCQADAGVPLSTSQSGIIGNWSGPGVSGNVFNPAAAGTGSVSLTFTPTPGQCAAPNSLNVQVNATTTPALTPIGPFCQTDAAVPLSNSQSGIAGTWSGPGVVGGNMFNPASSGTGSISITFTPSPGQCANANTLSVQVNPAVTPIL